MAERVGFEAKTAKTPPESAAAPVDTERKATSRNDAPPSESELCGAPRRHTATRT